MIRVRVSTLEAFRRVVATEYGREDELVAAIKAGQEGGPANVHMRAGTAWHALLAMPKEELAERYDATQGVHVQDVFAFDGVDGARRHVGPGVCEVTTRQVYDAFGVPVEVKGTTDHMRGLDLQDHKAKFSALDAKDYEPSLQWRFYLSLFGARSFRYNLFAFKEPADWLVSNLCELREILSFTFWPYPGMDDELRSWLHRFVSWARDRDLMGYLEAKVLQML